LGRRRNGRVEGQAQLRDRLVPQRRRCQLLRKTLFEVDPRRLGSRRSVAKLLDGRAFGLECRCTLGLLREPLLVLGTPSLPAKPGPAVAPPAAAPRRPASRLAGRSPPPAARPRRTRR